ncbi:MAG TPA: FG-GAP repeat protein [Methylomirabilota bacterium]|nr:FG-GAP repeat protein [Methylomirabilota bacterium]
MNILQAALLSIVFAIALVAPAGRSRAADSSFVQTAKLLAGDKTSGDQFGASVALSGDTAMVGAPGGDTAGALSGAVYVFMRDSAGQWQPGQKLVAGDSAAGDLFGGSIALHGDIALIGARGERSQGDFAGAVYVFTRDAAGIWQQTQKLIASDGSAGRLFGFSLALGDDVALVGARGTGDNGSAGAAYIFARNEQGQWQQAQKLTAAAAAPNDEFGCSVAVSGAVILIGACGDGERGARAGAAYLFTPNGQGQWQLLQKLTASDGGEGDEFGYSVALSDALGVVGARFANGAENHTGAAYVFAQSPSPIGTLVSWGEWQKLTAGNGVTGDEFGARVALTADQVIIGAPNSGAKGTGSGAVYFFTLNQNSNSGNPWEQTQAITARDEATGDGFGLSLASDENIILVGAPFDDTTVTNADSTITTFTDAGALYALALTSIPVACESKTTYDAARCSGSFTIASVSDIDQYGADDFGRKDNNGKYKHVTVSGSLNDPHLVIASPCTITMQSGARLQGDFVSVDGRLGVGSEGSFAIEAARACLLSEQASVELESGALISAGDVTIRAAKKAAIGKGATIDMHGDLIIESTGDLKGSQALLDADAVATAGSIRLQALRTARLGANATVAVDGGILLQSTGTASSSQVDLGEGAKLQATDLILSAPREAKIGKQVAVRLTGQLIMASTGDTSNSSTTLTKGAQVAVGGDADITSGNKVVLDKKTVLSVTGELHVQAASPQQCRINKSATVTAGEKSGNCFSGNR